MSRELLSRSFNTPNLRHTIASGSQVTFLLAVETRIQSLSADDPLLMSRRLQHDIVLDYVTSAAYSSTARSLAQSSRPKRPSSTPVPGPGATENGARYASLAGDAAIPPHDGKGDGEVDVDMDMELIADGEGKGSGMSKKIATERTLEFGTGAAGSRTGGIVLDEQKLASIEWRRGEWLLFFLIPTKPRSGGTTCIRSAPRRRPSRVGLGGRD